MKLQCSCGAKFSVDVTPDMGRNPVRFVCPQCGLDSSDFVNGLIQQELAKLGAAASPPPPAPTAPPPPAPAAPRLSISHGAPAPAPVQAAAPAEPPPAPAGSRLRISHEAKPAEQPQESAPVSKFCARHRGVPVTEKCFVCQKPICPQCMDMFGYFCSPLCKNKADLQGMAVPEYAGQRFNVEARFWRKTGLIFGGVLGLIVLFIGAWIWYAWFGAVPHNYFKVRFEDHPAYSGKTAIVNKDQIVLLHGGTLARWDMRHNKQIWSQELVSQQQVDDLTKEEMAAQGKAAADDNSGMFRITPENEVRREVQMDLERDLLLRVSGQNIWVGNGDKLTHYDWNSGNPIGETTLPETGGELVEGDGELLMIGDTFVTHISLADGSSRVEQIRPPGSQPASTGVASIGGDQQAGGGLPLNGDDGKPLDPNKVNQDANNLKTPAKIALPALLSNAEHERQLENALKDDGQTRHRDTSALADTNDFQLIPAPSGYVAFSSTLLEEKTISRTAMKPKPKTSALDGDVNASKTFAVANEILNDMQRDRGGDTVEEDASLYKVTVHIPDAADVPDFTTNVTGAPQLIPLKTVNVLAAGYTLIVLDKSNKPLWQATLTYQMGPAMGQLFDKTAETGEGPAVEHGDTLYVYDQAVLTAFDLHTGNAKWRLPTVGVAGLFFDDQNNVYINTTTASPDDVKYSRQIDITKQTDDILMKVDPQTGKTLWTAKPGGFISYLSGKFIYAAQWYDSNPTDQPVLNDSGLNYKPNYLHVIRINPKNGRTMWDYYQDRAPISLHFDHNTIELVFKKEVQVLKFISF